MLVFFAGGSASLSVPKLMEIVIFSRSVACPPLAHIGRAPSLRNSWLWIAVFGGVWSDMVGCLFFRVLVLVLLMALVGVAGNRPESALAPYLCDPMVD